MKPDETLNTLLKRAYRVDPATRESHDLRMGWVNGMAAILASSGYLVLAAVLGFSGGIAVLLWDPGSGSSLSANPGKLWLALGVYAVGFGIYFVSRAVRQRQGIDLSLTYRELPPE